MIERSDLEDVLPLSPHGWSVPILVQELFALYASGGDPHRAASCYALP